MVKTGLSKVQILPSTAPEHKNSKMVWHLSQEKISSLLSLEKEKKSLLSGVEKVRHDIRIQTELNKCLKMAIFWIRSRGYPTMQHFNGMAPSCHLFTSHGMLDIVRLACKKKKNKQTSEPSPSSTLSSSSVMWSCLYHLLWGHDPCPCCASDGDETSLVTADCVWHHAAALPSGHTSLPMEFGITPKPWKDKK